MCIVSNIKAFVALANASHFLQPVDHPKNENLKVYFSAIGKRSVQKFCEHFEVNFSFGCKIRARKCISAADIAQSVMKKALIFK